MKKSLIITAATILLFAGCTEEKKETKVEAVKQEVVQTNQPKVEEAKVQEVKAEVKVVQTKTEGKKVEEAKSEVVVASNDGETLFKTCTSCHGTKGEKEALGKSQVIAGWDKDRVVKALNGYKDGTYGGVM